MHTPYLLHLCTKNTVLSYSLRICFIKRTKNVGYMPTAVTLLPIHHVTYCLCGYAFLPVKAISLNSQKGQKNLTQSYNTWFSSTYWAKNTGFLVVDHIVPFTYHWIVFNCSSYIWNKPPTPHYLLDIKKWSIM